jgi:hypothetical protein
MPAVTAGMTMDMTAITTTAMQAMCMRRRQLLRP